MPESKPAVAAAAPVAPVIIKQSSGKGVALGALVLSLLALGASGFLFVHSRPQALYVASAALAQALFVQAPPELAQNLKNLLYFTHHQRIADALRDYGVNRIQTGTLAQLLPACRKGEPPHD